MDKNTIISIVLIIASFAVSIAAYVYLPDKIATHWGIDGTPNGYSDKITGLLFVPIFSLGLYLILVFLPKFDPLKENIAKFSNTYSGFINVFLFFMLYIHIITIIQNLGFAFNMSYALFPGISFLFYFMGNMMKKAEMNWTIGIRTPWTMSSETVWKKTHLFAEKTFKTGAIISLLSLIPILIGKYETLTFMIFFASIMIAALAPVAYSFVEFNKEKKEKEGKK